MFLVLLLGGMIFGCIFASLAKDSRGRRSKVLWTLTIACVISVVSSFFTVQGRLYVRQIWVGGQSSNWLVVDNSGGQTLRHWIITSGYVESSSQSDGWKFFDSAGNLCYVSGDAFVINITEPMEEFQETYKMKYNIPTEQQTLR